MRILLPLLALLCKVSGQSLSQDRCTAILVGAKASASGTPMTTHSNDCSDCDFRLVKIPPMTHAPGAMRDIVLFNSQYPRYVGSARGPAYSQKLLDDGFTNWTVTSAIAQIPQVSHTFGYLEGVYGIVNDQQVAMGESTCGAKLASKPVSLGGAAYFDITELGRVALERTATARDAVLLMGNLAETYGYYGSGWDSLDPYGGAGEALTVTDPTEGWMFHILPDDTGASAVWVAQRVPDTHVAAIANEFVIHAIDLADSENFLGSTNLYSVALRNGFWDGKVPFDFAVVYASSPTWQYVMTRRVWRVLTLANPTLALSPDTDVYGTTYPFSVETAAPLTPLDLMRFQRDHYENTSFDLTQGPAAGPYGNPDRYGVGHDAAPGGHFERSISVFTSTYSFVSALDATNPNNAILWFGPYAPHATIYVPIYVKSEVVPPVASFGSLRKFNTSALFWANALVGNYATRWYKYAHPVVAAAQQDVETTFYHGQQLVQELGQAVLDGQGAEALAAYLATASDSFANAARDASASLFADLITRFHDGFIVTNVTSSVFSVKPMGYPQWWLDAVGYYNATSSTSSPVTVVHQAQPQAPSDNSCDVVVTGGVMAAFALLVVVTLGIGFHLGRRARPPPQRGYAVIQ
ncbi:Aste57867_1032 [Aphanomyces stellatus]|uniref:Aste57867_1032 protein n=1 Tax=Aphanomyces stellatus TaxID=120398 RepID=A0A485K461_9STRA|nr:hypothetical protein As57867_001031 [Aphanomyces stellatus]VFT78254.1 Aste57867_1032 [Aphanomyces stellatus]